MRIRKRHQNPLPAPDQSSSIAPPTAAAAAPVAPPVSGAGGATGGNTDGEAMAAVAAHASAGGYGGGGGGGLHPKGSTTNPTACPPLHPPPSAATAAGTTERGDLPQPGPPLPTRIKLFPQGSDCLKAPKGEQDTGEDGGDIVIAHSHSGGNAPAPKCSGAEASEAPVLGHHGGHKILLSAAVPASAVEEAVARWRDQGVELPMNKRGGGYHAQERSLGLHKEEEEENAVAEREMRQHRPSNARRRRAAAATTMATPAAAAAELVGGNHGGGNGKKRRSPAVLMEGSRCSRVNGRGWRCCQQTLVGYSLCEHHLGKGRLRSVSSVRCNNGRARKKEEAADGAAPPLPSVLLLRQQDQFLPGKSVHEEEEKPSERRNKIGVVKARSISSLLHQTDHAAPTTIASPARFPSPSPLPLAAGQVATAAPPPP